VAHGQWKGEEEFVCSRCDAEFESEDELSAHTVERHGDD
jgi:uncharacterized C2H2 Zn-finger protein